jgi:hypothetical protein
MIRSLVLAYGLVLSHGQAAHAQPLWGADDKERLQIGLMLPDRPFEGNAFDPTVLSTRWRDGDVEVLIAQAAPCGAWIPMNPSWHVAGRSIALTYDWSELGAPNAKPGSLCMKSIRAWVFRLPKGQYNAKVSAKTRRFSRAGESVVSTGGR